MAESFSVTQVFKVSFQTTKRYWSAYLLSFILVAVVLGCYQFLLGRFVDPTATGFWLVSLLIGLVLGVYLKLVLTKVSLAAVKNHQPVPRLALRLTPKELLQAVIASVLFGILKVLGFLFLIIPGIIATVAFGFYIYSLADKRTSAVSSLEDSLRITRGSRWQILGFYLSLLLCWLVVFGGIALLVVSGLYFWDGNGDWATVSTTGVITGAGFLIGLGLVTGLFIQMLGLSGTAFMYTKLRTKTSLPKIK